jgi:hypothetical protein
MATSQRAGKMFYHQPDGQRFGDELKKEFNDIRWQAAEIAVAWIRESGARHLRKPLRRFLLRGGALRLTVGIDIENTSYEGLLALLRLKKYGLAEVFVYHNEAFSTFHPKVYLFHNDQIAKLIIGSNNLTGSGLFVNVEAALGHEAGLVDPLIIAGRTALASWRDPSDRLAQPLTAELLKELLTQGYVFKEARLRRRRTQFAARVVRERRKRTLFGRKGIFAPALGRKRRKRQGGKNAAQRAGVVGRILLMRVRKASATQRPTQTQMPKKVYQHPFFQGIESITSRHDGRSHRVIRATARGIVNTLKLEIPEMRDFVDPVVRLERTASGIFYETFDADSLPGRPIMSALERGRKMSPPATRLTVSSAPETATWWRFT